MGKTLVGTLLDGNWDQYHREGIVPQLWAGITGQKSAEMQTEDTLKQSNEQFNKSLKLQEDQFNSQLDFLNKQHSEQMDFANRQLADNTRIADLNFGLQQEAFNYQKELNSTQMEREDSAMQRQIADLKAAGMSPLAAIGSSGLGSSALSSGSPAQYDMSGINAAAGQYADFARQYSQLHMQASQNYSNNRSQLAQKHNSDILGAKMALSQMKSDMHYKGLSAANQVFDSAVNAKNKKIQNEYMNEELNYLKDKHYWEEIHGYRDSSLSAAIANFATKLADKYDLGDKATNAIDNVVDNIKLAVDDTKESIQKKVTEEVNKIKDLSDDTKQKLGEAVFKSMWKIHKDWKSKKYVDR